MAWKRKTITIGKKTQTVWVCDKYSDLNYSVINNFAEYGQPASPYSDDFDHNHTPDFNNIIIQMPQSEVMLSGYGKFVRLEDFPIVNDFFDGKLNLGVGTYKIDTLIKSGNITKSDRRIVSNLYGPGITISGSITPADAAYIHGTVGFSLMQSTEFIVTKTQRRVDAWVGALDDNWDFQSGTTAAQLLNPAVRVLAGPGNYNLQNHIIIEYTGLGRRIVKMKSR